MEEPPGAGSAFHRDDKAFDLKLAETLSARICHDMVSPVGAISNGVELLEDEPDFTADATRLIAQSALQATRRLQFFRVAFGSIADIAVELARAAMLDLFSDGKVACDWPEQLTLPTGSTKLACNLLFFASEALPRGGRIVLTLVDSPHGDILAAVATGVGARVNDPLPALIAGEGKIDDLAPRTAQAALTQRLADRLGARLQLRQDRKDEVALVVIPGAV